MRGKWTDSERYTVANRLRMLRNDAFLNLQKAERSRRDEAEKELCRKVYGEDIAALEAAIAIVSGPLAHPQPKGEEA